MLTKRRRNQCYMCCNANTLPSWSFVGNQIEDSMVNGKLSGFAMNVFFSVELPCTQAVTFLRRLMYVLMLLK